MSPPIAKRKTSRRILERLVEEGSILGVELSIGERVAASKMAGAGLVDWRAPAGQRTGLSKWTLRITDAGKCALTDTGHIMSTEHYATDRGSTVEVSGKYRGRLTISFDWFEEGACPDAQPSVDVIAPGDAMLSWCCNCHEPGSNQLERKVNQ